MKRLIVNADDFGFTRLVSQGILDAHYYGIVTSTSLVPNGEAFEEAIAMAKRAPRLSVGVHLTLTQGMPVLPASEVPTLVETHGRLHSTASQFLDRVVTRRISLSEIELEFRSQIDRVFEAGITPTHLDGHKHVHVLPGISEIVIRLAQEFGIRSVRCPMEEFALTSFLRCLRDPTAGVFQAVSRRARGQLVRPALQGETDASRTQLILNTFTGLSETGFWMSRKSKRSCAAYRKGLAN